MNHYFNGKFILHTKISHGEKELESFHIGMMSRQCKLDKKKFLDLANCPLTAEKYVEILKESGIIPDTVVATERRGNKDTYKKKKKKK